MKEIILTQGKVALVDDDDFERLNKNKWHAIKDYNTYYGRGWNDGKKVKIHNLIIETPCGMEIDHINGNGLDNRKKNLRICTPHQNKMNRGLRTDNTSKAKGVCFMKNNNKWSARVCLNGNRYYLGLFKSKVDAIKAYNEKARELYGEFAYINKI